MPQPKMENIWIDEVEISPTKKLVQLSIDWSNDRHQRIRLPHLDPESVKHALIYAAELIESEQVNGDL